eukprot:scaffold40823_cov60-Attheya_sp.AAC.6
MHELGMLHAAARQQASDLPDAHPMDYKFVSVAHIIGHRKKRIKCARSVASDTTADYNMIMATTRSYVESDGEAAARVY